MSTAVASKIREGPTGPSADARKLRVLLVKDNPLDAELVLAELRHGGFEVECDLVQTDEEFLERVRAGAYEVVLADYSLPQWSGMEALRMLRREGLDVPLILVSGSLGEVTAVECIKQGATDYVLKDALARLPVSVRRALEEHEFRKERERTQEELGRKVDELARSNHDLEQFAYVASHDLQEPLRMVAAYTQLLAERYQGKLDEQADKYIQYAVDGATRMQTLIRDLLAFSRAGRQETEFALTDCSVLMEEAMKNLRFPIQESGASVLCGTLPTVSANAAQLRQVFQNLLENALKFRGPAPPRVEISAEQHGTEWTFSVKDSGIGIASEHAESIFAVFQRLHTRSEYPGNGIGLAICKKVVERHGGRIWMEPQPGQGSTFKFTLSHGLLTNSYTHENEKNSRNLAS